MLALIEENFDVFLTIDQNIQHQQNLSVVTFAVIFVSVPDNTIAAFAPLFDLMREAVEESKPGDIRVVP